VGVNPQSSEKDVLAEREAALIRLQQVPNVGQGMAADLVKLSITSLEKAAGRNSDEMYHGLCVIDAKRNDPCVRDVFAAVVSQAEGNPPRPWWEFTPERKAREAREKRGGKEKA
jgi:hypothetical protein